MPPMPPLGKEWFDEVPLSVVADVPSNVTESIQSIWEGKSMTAPSLKMTLIKKIKEKNTPETR